MTRLRRWWAALAERARALFARRAFEADLDEELRYHIEAATERNLRRGMSPSEARRAALRAFGGVERTKEAVRSETGVRLLQDLAQDVRYALRGLARRPVFASVLVLTIAVCTGANGGVLAMVDSILLEPLPFPESERLVRIFNAYPAAGEPRTGASVPQYFDYEEHVDALDGVALYREESNIVGDDEGGRHAFALRVTSSFFPVLRAEAALGRTFARDLAPDAREVVIGHDLWQEAFGGAPDAIGQTVMLDGSPWTIIGVLPASFRLSTWDAQVFTPIVLPAGARSIEDRHGDAYQMIGRLAPGVSVEEARSRIASLERNLMAEYPPELRNVVVKAGYRTEVRPFLADLTRDVRRPFLLLQAGVLLVMVIGAANVTGLLFVRAHARTREVAARMALGASRARLLRQLVTESTVLALAGGVAGMLLARWSLGLLGAFEVYQIPRVDDVAVDGTVVAITLAVVALLGTVAGAAPIGSLLRQSPSLIGGARGTVRGSPKAGRILVGGQIALAFVLVMSAGLLVSSLRSLLAVDPGFDPEGVSVAALTLPGSRYPTHDSRLQLEQRLFAAVEAIPGVQGVAMASQLPFSGSEARGGIVPDGTARPAGEAIDIPFRTVVSPGWFDVMAVRLLEGRPFLATDGPDDTRVVVVDATLAREYWPEGEAVGQHLWLGGVRGTEDEALTVVGVVEPIRQNSLMDERAAGAVYLPHTQASLQFFRLAVRHEGPRSAIWPAVADVVASVDPGLVLFWNDTLEGSVAGSLILQRTPMQLLTAFAVLGLFLGSLGVYGVTAFEAARRRREIGLRLALGGTAAQIVALLGREWLTVVGAGVGVGLLGAVAATPLLRGLLYGVGTMDPTVAAAALATVVLAATAACVPPVRRALRVDPAATLKEE